MAGDELLLGRSVSQAASATAENVSEAEPLPAAGCRLIAYRLHEYDSFLKIVPAPPEAVLTEHQTKLQLRPFLVREPPLRHAATVSNSAGTDSWRRPVCRLVCESWR